MEHFTKEFLNFFSKLEKNNTTDWFKQNKKDYESYVKVPFEFFVSELINLVAKHEKNISMTAREAIFRINKDTRFSKDKSPYKISMSAAVSVGGRNPECPGIFVELSHVHLLILCGAHMVEKDNLEKIRDSIAQKQKEFSKLINDKSFKAKFGTVRGEQNKLLPPKFKELMAQQPLIANKQFYYQASLPSKTILSEDLIKTIESYYLTALPMNRFLMEALKGS